MTASGTWVDQQCAAQQLSRAEHRFSRRELRDFTGLSDTQLRVHLERLVELEYVLVHRGMRGQSFVYELLFDGAADSEAPHLCGLIDVATMMSSRDEAAQLAGSSRGQRAPIAVGARMQEISANPVSVQLIGDALDEDCEKHLPRVNGHGASYVSSSLAAKPLS